MHYPCGTKVMLNDQILVNHGPGLYSLARVVAIGVEEAVKDIDRDFHEWALDEEVLSAGCVVVQWISDRSRQDDDPGHVPVGEYLTLETVCSEEFVRRGSR